MSTPRSTLAVIVLAVAIFTAAVTGVGTAGECVVNAIGIDTSLAEPDTVATLGLRCCEAGGETFLARDTLLRSITVWRAHQQVGLVWLVKLWITEVDSAGDPDTHRPVYEGPAQSFPFGDGIHPIEMKFLLDPPLALPHAGKFYFAVQEYNGFWLNLLVNHENAYPYGYEARSGITCHSGCWLRAVGDTFRDYDLVFTIEFCSDAQTRTSESTWGKLKVLYR